MAEIRHVEIVNSPYLNDKSSDFDEIWYTTANLELYDMTKYENFYNSKWRRFLAITQQLIVRFQWNFVAKTQQKAKEKRKKK